MNGMKEWSAAYPLNIRVAKDVVDNDREMLEELFSIFLDHLPEQLEQIEASIRSKDGERMQFYAHQLKGAMRNFAAESACERAFELERSGKENSFDNVDSLLQGLKEEISVLKKYIEKEEWRKYF